MKVLITGVAGFLGGHVAKLFMDNGWEAAGIDNLAEFELSRAKFNVEKSRAYNLDYLKEIGTEFHKKDCRTITVEEVKKMNVDYIVHCAAQPAMTIALETPSYDADNNILGTLNMLCIARELKLPFVTCSSIHVYGNNLNQKLKAEKNRFIMDPKEIDEKAPVLNGELTPLHVSKYTTELYTQSFAECFSMKTATFRLTGMYGERQFGGMDHGWVANFAIRIAMGRELTVFGTDKQVRDILYASDAAQAFLDWFNNGQPVGVFNIGGGYQNSISIYECIEALSKFTKKAPNVKLEPKRQGDLWYFVCDHNKAKKEFGWSPKISTNEGLERISNWIRENPELFK